MVYTSIKNETRDGLIFATGTFIAMIYMCNQICEMCLRLFYWIVCALNLSAFCPGLLGFGSGPGSCTFLFVSGGRSILGLVTVAGDLNCTSFPFQWNGTVSTRNNILLRNEISEILM